MSTKSLIKLAETWASHNALMLSTVSTYAANDGKFFGKLKLGSGCTLKTAARISQWFSDNWPEDLEWPEGIQRPPVSKNEEVA